MIGHSFGGYLVCSQGQPTSHTFSHFLSLISTAGKCAFFRFTCPRLCDRPSQRLTNTDLQETQTNTKDQNQVPCGY